MGQKTPGKLQYMEIYVTSYRLRDSLPELMLL